MASYTGNNGRNNIAGTTVDDQIYGLGGDDTLRGQDGRDRLYGGAGLDQLYGGEGVDTLEGGAGADYLDGGGSYDYVSYATAASGVTVHLDARRGLLGDALGDRFNSIEGVVGSNFGDYVRGDAAGNALYGLSGADTLFGLGGDDLLVGDAGDDLMVGGAGADQFQGGDGVDMVSYATETSGAIADLRNLFNGGSALGDRFTGVEQLRGSAFADRLGGDAGLNTLSGGAGDDTLIGGAGADRLEGEAGRDTASYETSATAVSLNLATGRGIGGDARGDVLVSIESVTGSNFSDLIWGSAGDDLIAAIDGNDLLIAGDGHDSLYGGTGADTLQGGSGADLLEGGQGDDVLIDTDGGTVFIGGAYGSDTVDYSSVADPSRAIVANLAAMRGSVGGVSDVLKDIENVIGGAGDDDFFGSTANNRFDGRAGDDFFAASAGADTMIGGEGFDRVSYSGSDAAVEITLGTGRGVGGLANGDLLSGIEQVEGSQYNDTIFGDGADNLIHGEFGNDWLTGGNGNDTLVGSVGRDTLIGGAGADVYRFDTPMDGSGELWQADSIVFQKGDLIDLSRLDADSEGKSGNQAFVFVGQGGTDGPGQVRWFASGNQTIVECNMAGPGVSEFTIIIEGAVTLSASDFIL